MDGTLVAVGIDGAGNFVVGGNVVNDVAMQRFAADGTTLGPVMVADFVSNNRAPLIAMNDAGEWVLHFGRLGFESRRYNAHGVEQGEWQYAGDHVTTLSGTPGSALDDAGNLFAAYSNAGILASPGGGPPMRLTLDQFDADGQLESTETRPGTLFSGVDVAVNNSGRIVAVSGILEVSPGASSRLVVECFQELTLRVTGLSTTQGEMLSPKALAIGEVGELVVHLSLPASTAGGATGVHSVINPANWQLLRYAEDVSDFITHISYSNGRVTLSLSQTLPAGKCTLVAKDSIHDASAAPLDGDENGTPGGTAMREFQVSNLRPLGEQTILGDGLPAARVVVAANSAGQSMVVWARANTVQAQRYDASGQPVGTPLLIDDTAGNYLSSNDPLQVGLNADGSFLVLWRDTSNSVLQRYDSNGTAVGDLQLVQPGGSGGFALASDGRFAIASNSDVKVYDAGGSLQWTAPVTPGGKLAFDANGILIVARQGGDPVSENSPAPGVSVLRFATDGTPLGQIVVADAITGKPMVPNVAANSQGGFSVVWQLPSDSLLPTFYRSDSEVFVRSYDADGQPLGNAFQVNSGVYVEPENIIGGGTPNTISPPGIAFDGAGHLVVAWQTLSADYYDVGLNVRAFLPGGDALGPPQRLNLDPNRNQLGPMLAGRGGNVFAVWTGPATYLQRFDILEPPILDLSNALPGTDFHAGLIMPDGNPVAIADTNGLIVSSNNAGELQSATIRVVDTLPGDLLSVNTSGTSIVASYADGTLSLLGLDTLANYQQVLRTATFATTAIHPGSADIEIEFVVNDGTSDSPTATARASTTRRGSGSIAGRYVFYNNSSFTSGNNRRGGIATDKTAYLPNTGTATFANVTSYTPA